MDDRFPPAILIGSGVTVVGDLDDAQVEAYWKAVDKTLRTIFGEDDAAPAVASARARLEGASAETRRLFYHASPFQVASDLAGRTEAGLSERQLSSYREIITAFNPALYPLSP